VPKIPTRWLDISETVSFSDDLVESAREISESQLINSKIIPSREHFIKYLPENLRYLEIGVAWGYYADLVCSKNPSAFHLMDTYSQDLKCWSWRKFGECKCDGKKHELLYLPETHQAYIDNRYREHNVLTIKGKAPDQIDQSYEYDFIYIDFINERFAIRDTLNKCKDMVPVGGYLGINDYLIYDGIIEDSLYGTYQATNEFLSYNKNWEVAFFALHPIGFYDIYLRKTHER
jgi:hypothetical protein